MAGLSQSVDVSISAALANIARLDAALKKAVKQTVTLNTTAAAAKISSLSKAMDKVSKARSIQVNTAQAQAKVDRLAATVDKAVKAKPLTIDTSRAKAQVDSLGKSITASQTRQAASSKAISTQIASSVTAGAAAQLRASQTFGAREVAAKRASQTQINAINQQISTFAQRQQQEQAQGAERAAREQAAAVTRSAREQQAAQNRGFAQQRQVLSAQLSQVRSFQNIGQTFTFGFTLPVAAAAASLAKLSFSFEDTINRIRILTVPAFRTSSSAVDDLRASILALATDTGRTPTELATGFYQIASAGVAGAEALQVLKAAGQAATIGLGDTNTVADITTSVLNAYGGAAGNAFQVTNTLAEAVRLAKGEASDFAPVLGRVLPVANNLGVAFSDVAASVALLTRNGLSASEATTQFRGLLNTFIKPSIQARTELDRVGLSSTQLLGQLKAGDFKGVLTEIKTAFGGDQLGLGRLFRNQQGLNAFLSLTKDLKSTSAAFKEVGSAADQSKTEVSGFSEIKDTPTVKFRIALASVQAQLLKIGASIGPVVVSITKLAGTLLNFFNSLPAGVRNFALLGLATAAIIPPALLVYAAIQRLRIAQQQLAVAQRNSSVESDRQAGAFTRQGTALGKVGQVLGGNAGAFTKFAGAVTAVASAGAAFSLGGQLATAGSASEKVGSALGIAGTALTSFVAGSAVGGPIVGGLAAGITGLAATVGFLGHQADAQKEALNAFRDSLIGINDEAERAGKIQSGVPKVLQTLLQGDKLGQIELPDFEKAGVDVKAFGGAIAKGGQDLKDFNKEAANKIAARQFAEIKVAVEGGAKALGDAGDETKGLFNQLVKGGAAIETQDIGGNLSVKITDAAKALAILQAGASRDLNKVSGAFRGPIDQAAEMDKIVSGLSGDTADAGGAMDDAADSVSGFGDAADGSAQKIQDLIGGLNDAVKAAEDLNNARLDAFTGQVDLAAGTSDLVDALAKGKNVIPTFNQNIDLTTKKGRNLAKSQKDVADAFSEQIGKGEESARALLAQAGGVDKAKFAYTQFFNQQKAAAASVGVTGEQFDLLAQKVGAAPTQVFADWGAAGVTAANNVSTAMQSVLDAIGPEAAAAVQAIDQPSDQVAALAGQIALLPDKKVFELFAQVTNADTVNDLADTVQDLPEEKQVQVLAAVVGKPGVDALVAQIVDALPAEKISNVLAKVAGTPAAKDLANVIVKELPASKISAVLATVKGTPAANDLNAAIARLPAKKRSQVEAVVAGLSNVTALGVAIAKLQNKTVSVHINTFQTGVSASGPSTARGAFYGRGGMKRYASGHISREPMIARARSGQGILWAEPETMGEAYIPFSNRYRGRAKAILQRTAQHMGMMVVPVPQPHRYAQGGFVLDRNLGGGLSDATIRRLTQTLSNQQGPHRDAPLVGQVVVETQAQDPASIALVTGNAVGRKMHAVLNGRN